MSNLERALQNPSAVILSGPAPVEHRNALKKTNKMVLFGASVMLGVALLSPLNALASNQQTLDPQPQTTSQTVSFDESMREEKLEQELEQIATRQNAPTLSFRLNEYRTVRKVLLEKKELNEASQENVDYFVSRLAQDAYIEMQAGHTVENPSQRLVDICQQVEDVASQASVGENIPHAETTFKACQSEQMQENMTKNTVQKSLGLGGVVLGALLAKSLSLLAFFKLGSSVLGGGSLASAVKKKRDLNAPSDSPTPPTLKV